MCKVRLMDINCWQSCSDSEKGAILHEGTVSLCTGRRSWVNFVRSKPRCNCIRSGWGRRWCKQDVGLVILRKKLRERSVDRIILVRMFQWCWQKLELQVQERQLSDLCSTTHGSTPHSRSSSLDHLHLLWESPVAHSAMRHLISSINFLSHSVSLAQIMNDDVTLSDLSSTCSPLSPSITHSLFHSMLKTLFSQIFSTIVC